MEGRAAGDEIFCLPMARPSAFDQQRVSLPHRGAMSHQLAPMDHLPRCLAWQMAHHGRPDEIAGRELVEERGFRQHVASGLDVRSREAAQFEAEGLKPVSVQRSDLFDGQVRQPGPETRQRVIAPETLIQRTRQIDDLAHAPPIVVTVVATRIGQV